MLQLVLMVMIAPVRVGTQVRVVIDGVTVGTQVRVVMMTHPPRQDIA